MWILLLPGEGLDPCLPDGLHPHVHRHLQKAESSLPARLGFGEALRGHLSAQPPEVTWTSKIENHEFYPEIKDMGHYFGCFGGPGKSSLWHLVPGQMLVVLDARFRDFIQLEKAARQCEDRFLDVKSGANNLRACCIMGR